MARSDWEKRLHQSKVGLANAFKMMVGGRFTPPYEAPYSLVLEEGMLRLRHYTPSAAGMQRDSWKPVLLIPPLMVTSQVYDISPSLSSVGTLLNAGCDVWLTDFGIPEREPGGMDRTLDDHIVAISRAVDVIHESTGQDVHLIGYSQGGMFAYQVAAYRQSQNIASIVAFGSPVDLSLNAPGGVHKDLVQRFFSAVRSGLGWTLNDLKGIPGHFSSLGFKLVSPRQEIRYLRMMLGILDDEEALSRLEPTRRFLGGEGFIAWPGPALRTFIEEIVVNNRMIKGGLVFAGRTVSLADITCPILYFVGHHDDFARPPSVRAITKVAVEAPIYEQSVTAGHFGLVVGSRANTQVWPSVIDWVRWEAGEGGLSERVQQVLPQPSGARAERTSKLAEPTAQVLLTEFLQDAWERVGERALDVTAAVGWIRWQTPRLMRLLSMSAGLKVSISKLLEEQAQRIPNQTFFLWQGRAFTYKEADMRVNQVLRAMLHVGVKPHTNVAIMMDNHPDYLTVLTALNRMGCVAVLLNPSNRGKALEHAVTTSDVQKLVVDFDHASVTREDLPTCDTLVLGHGEQELPDGAISLDAVIRPQDTEPPDGITPNAGLPDDVALYIFTSGTTGLPKAAKITNRRWMLGATVAAVCGALTPNDTVYCCLPLFHGSGLMLASGGALVGGSRLALAKKFSRTNFWKDVRNVGATVVFYIGELCRYLISSPQQANERNHPVRLFMGNGLRQDVWEEMLRRFGNIRVMEFYAATEGNTFMINLTGEKIGSIGRVPLDLSRVTLVKYDIANDSYIRDEQGFHVPCEDNEPGMMLTKIESWNPTSRFDGYTDTNATKKKILHNVYEYGDSWFVSGDFLKRDEDGDYWFVDRLGDTFRWKGENISTDEVAKVLSHVPFVEQVAVYGVQLPQKEGRAGMAAIQVREGKKFSGKKLYRFVEESVVPAGRPRFVRVVDSLETTDTFKIKKFKLQQEGPLPEDSDDPIYWYNTSRQTYTKLDPKRFEKIITKL
ncbi:MAG: alpha/beta fold hydrolase [Deltaproteobacteria bacterium]|nr:MAG: alpha/beta fold hydrolase [Deltaproteobacteria bacterium]